MVKNKYELHKLAFPIDGIYRYEVRRWSSVAGEPFMHCGFGKFCRTKAEAEAYRKEMEAVDRAEEKKEERGPEKVLDGTYYFFDCMNAFVNGGLFPAREFDGENEAVKMAADYEAILYRYEFTDGRKTGCRVLYDPGECFG